MKRIYTLKELSAMPTLEQGHTDDLKIKTEVAKVWLSRLTVADGQPYDNQVTVEKLKADQLGSSRRPWRGSRWETVKQYQAK